MQKLDTDIIRLRDMLQAVKDAEAFAKGGLEDRQALFATAYAVAIIGEAAGKVSPALQERYPEVPWPQITGMRHRIIHDYGRINVERLHEVVKTHLPLLKAQISEILSHMNSSAKEG